MDGPEKIKPLISRGLLEILFLRWMGQPEGAEPSNFGLTRTSHEATAAAARAVIPNGVAREFASRAKRGRATQ
jgi:hypothetical protein